MMVQSTDIHSSNKQNELKRQTLLSLLTTYNSYWFDEGEPYNPPDISLKAAEIDPPAEQKIEVEFNKIGVFQRREINCFLKTLNHGTVNYLHELAVVPSFNTNGVPTFIVKRYPRRGYNITKLEMMYKEYLNLENRGPGPGPGMHHPQRFLPGSCCNCGSIEEQKNIAKESATKENMAEGNTTVKDATAKDATAKDATANDATAKDVTAQDVTAKDATAQEGTAEEDAEEGTTKDATEEQTTE